MRKVNKRRKTTQKIPVQKRVNPVDLDKCYKLQKNIFVAKIVFDTAENVPSKVWANNHARTSFYPEGQKDIYDLCLSSLHGLLE